jgi:hypothetical protein
MLYLYRRMMCRGGFCVGLLAGSLTVEEAVAAKVVGSRNSDRNSK